ncbi:NACHT domain-containing protein [Streptomyces sp. NBC_01190]|uniref:NACHT domain-containing protein n=1 Tax=Streptomyces sp. NBC_01190 TaxID=2903767 RepID=UPI00386BBC35|nr:hypothetical protein OG519_16245 [Streptomyces sp. NBC_01190]
MKYELYRLGPREFENLTQAITVAELGPTVSLFGAGPDGGREATFEGSTSPAWRRDGWDGYGILQSKYKESPSNPRNEASWLISEIRKEFKEWRTSAKRTKKPEFIIFATNVTLSPTPKSGGYDRVEKVMKEECEKLGIKNWIVWHAENISRFLDIHNGIRTSYSAWMLPGDILSAIYDQMQTRGTDVAKAINSYLAREIVKDRYANLDQAGASDDRMISLAQVFVDLPIGSTNDRPREQDGMCLETLIAACDIRHSPEDEANQESTHHSLPPNRFVLVGGPGQGKSTVSQFICQLYRALLVQDTTSMRNADVRSTVTQIASQAEKENLSPRARRWPIKIPLTRLADELAQGKCKNLLDYTAQRISEAGSTDVTSSDMRDWLCKFPWLVILDGLDEVPSSSNRSQVLDRISDFQIEADECNADLVVVATTRPQGYTDDFSPKNYRHFSLTPLSREKALKYGHKLAQARYGSAFDRVTRLMFRLEQAADEASTVHLMATPLQVTIMAVLLDRVGKAPKDRYTLFRDYYRVIYERELEKEGPASNLLRDHSSDISSIHADVGLMLQTRSERSGETESRLTLDELNSIISDRLAGEGHSGERLNKLTSAISLAATDRLVFLVPSRGGEVSFEIRSLQEFWAADALMNCTEEQISQRLRSMSISAHWRNVLLFALGNIFAHRRTLRDSAIALVAELNSYSVEFGTLQRRILTGSRLAVEILGDGMVRAPRYEMTLLEESLKLLKLPPGEHIQLLASSLSELGASIAHDYLDADLAGAVPNPGVLEFLSVRAVYGDEWAKEKLLEIYERASDEEREYIHSTGLELASPVLIDLASSAMENPASTIRMARNSSVLLNYKEDMRPSGIFLAPDWLEHLLRLFSGRERSETKIIFRGEVNGFSLDYVSVEQGSQRLVDTVTSGLPNSHWLCRIYDFQLAPSKDTLAEVVLALSPYRTDFRSSVTRFPWIISYSLFMFEEIDGSAIQSIREGILGDLSDWIELERKWSTEDPSNFLKGSFSQWCEDRSPFLPFLTSLAQSELTRRTLPGQPGSPGFVGLANLCREVSDEDGRTKIANHILASLHSIPYRIELESFLSPDFMRFLYQSSKTSYVTLTWLSHAHTDEEWLAVLNEIGGECAVSGIWVNELPIAVAEKWVESFEFVGLGRIVVSAAQRHGIPSEVGRKILLEWERVKYDTQVTSDKDRILALTSSMLRPPTDEVEAEVTLQLLVAAIKDKMVYYTDVVRQVALDHLSPSRNLITGLLDNFSDGMDHYDAILTYERLISIQSGAPTNISFEETRPL